MQLTDSYAINLDWYEQNQRSFVALVKSRMCKACQKKLGEELEARAPADYIATIKDCCSKGEGFITPKSPIMETIFRIFLANGNQSLSLKELSQQLIHWWGDSAISRVPSLQTLRRLLDNDQYYGLCRVLEEGKGQEEVKAKVEEEEAE